MKALTVSEKLDFERTGEPLKKMSIGQAALDKKIMDETDWAIDMDKHGFMYEIIELIRNYNGFPILVLKNKQNLNSWPYRAISVRGAFGDYCDTAEKALKILKDSIDIENAKEKASHDAWKASLKKNESQNFERGQDPIRAMDIGMFEFDVEFSGDIEDMEKDEKRMAKKWSHNGIKIVFVDGNADEDSDELYFKLSDGDEIIFKAKMNPGHTRPDKPDYAKISIKSLGIKEFEVFSDWSDELENGSIIGAIMKMYEDIKDGKMKVQESQNFERGGDPMDTMDIGRVQERKQKIIDEITKFNSKKYGGSSVLIKYLSFHRDWDLDKLEKDSIENLKYALKYLEKWEQIDKKIDKKQKNFKINETVNFERGQDPKQSMGIGQEFLAKKFKEFLEDELSWKGSRVQIINNSTAFIYKCWPGQSMRGVLVDMLHRVGWEDKYNVSIIDNWTPGDPDGNTWHEYLITPKTRKAKKIKESINFERGQDPKDSLKIGIKNKRSFKTVRECAQFFIDNIAKLSEGRFKDADDLKRAFQDNKYANAYGNPNSNKSPLKMSKDYLDGFRERDTMGNVLSQKYYPIYIEEWGTDFGHVLERLKSLSDFHIDLQKILGLHKEDIVNHKGVKESANFTREGTPIEKMGIGSEDLRMVAKMDHWAKEYSFEKYDYLDEYQPEEGYKPLQKWMGPKGQWIVLEKNTDPKSNLGYWCSWKGWEYGKDGGLARGFSEGIKNNWERYFGYPLVRH